MNPEAQAELKRIKDLPVNEVTPLEIDFLRARWSYLGNNSKNKFKEVVKAREKELKIQAKEEDKEEENTRDAVVNPEAEPVTDTSTHPADQETNTEQSDTDDGEDEIV